MKHPNIAFVGAGKMALSIAQGIVEKDYSKENIRCFVRNETNAERIRKEFQFFASTKIQIQPNEVIVIGVKPQQFEALLPQLLGKLDSSNLIISIMAGTPIEKLRKLCPTAEVVRVMPNTSSQVLKGMSVFCGSENTQPETYQFCSYLFSPIGKILHVEKEDLIDACTAISGSGPGYVFYLAENLKKVAIQLGFSESEAKLLAKQTLLGASCLMDKSTEEIETLRKNVMSPGGTTEAACHYFDQNQMDKIIQEGCKKSYERAKELSKM